MAISLNRVLYIVPFDLSLIKNAHTWIQLSTIPGAIIYNKSQNLAPPKSVRWSADGKTMAINVNSVDSGQRVDLISLFRISSFSGTATPFAVDNFPAARFSMNGYSGNPVIPTFATDGITLFVLNSKIRYELGYLYAYNTETRRGENLDPIGTACCYTAARFSPDGSRLFFYYRNLDNTSIKLYYVSYGTIGSGVTYTPLDLPEDFFSVVSDHLDATLRPVKP